MNIFSRPFFNFTKFLISKYPYLHKIDRIYVDVKSKEISVEVNQKPKQVEIRNFYSVNINKHMMKQETFDRIKEILKA